MHTTRILKWLGAFVAVAALLWASGIAPSAYNLIISGSTSLPSRSVLKFVNAGCVDNSGTTPPETDCTFGAVFSQTNSVTNAVQTTETSLVGTGAGSNVLAANYYSAGTVLKYEASGFYSTTGSPGTLTIKIKHSGGVTSTVIVGNTGAITPISSVTNGAWRLWGDITCRTTGTGGTFIINTSLEMNPSSLSTLTPANASVVNTSVVTIDTTAAQTVDLTTAWSASGQSISMTNFLLFSPNTSSTSSGGGGTGFIQTLTAPIAANFTATNFNTGSGVVTTQTNMTTPVTAIALLQHDPNATNNMAVLAKSKLAATFTLTIGFTIADSINTNALGGLWLADASGGPNILWWTTGQPQFGERVSFFTSFTSFSSDDVGPTPQPIRQGPIVWMRVQETASARIFFTSSDGQNFAQIFSESNTNHFTTTRYGWGIAARSASAAAPEAIMTVYSVTESNP